MDHATLVAAGIEVPDLSVLQMPRGHDVHVGLVVAAKDTRELVGIAQDVALQRGDAHIEQTFGVVGQQEVV